MSSITTGSVTTDGMLITEADHLDRGSEAMTEHSDQRPTRLLRAALAAVAAGWFVFPVGPRAKTPAVKDWENEATQDPCRITNWWTARPYNIGIATGPSGLLVIDLDSSRGHIAPEPWTGAGGGRDVLARIAAAAGQPMPDDTYTVATPTGGEHLYFRAPQGTALRNTAGALGWRIDTRGHGGFVVAAGSVRAEGLYRVIRPGTVAPLPDWLISSLTPPAAPVAPSSSPDAVLTPARARAYLQAIIGRETRGVADAPTGQRHRTLLRASRTLGRLVAGGELNEADARAALDAAAARHIGVDGTTAREVAQTIDDGLAYGAHAPRTLGGPSER